MALLSTSHSFILLSFSLSLFFSFGLCSVAVESDAGSRLPSNREVDDLCPGSPPVSCPINCFRADPVCGEDGVTYWCGCPDAMCAGTRVAKVGVCEVGNGGSGPVSALGKDPMEIYCGNQVTIHVANKAMFHKRTKHIEVDCHFIRDMVVNKQVVSLFVRSVDQLGDIFTKALG